MLTFRMANFKNLELYYLAYHKSCEKSSDLIALFYHWYMIQNDFKCVLGLDNFSDLLPQDWNKSTIATRYYVKNSDNYHFELDSSDDKIVLVKIRKLNTPIRLFQKIKSNEFINDHLFDHFSLAYKNIDKLYHKVERFIQHLDIAKEVKGEIKQETDSCDDNAFNTAWNLSSLASDECKPILETNISDSISNSDQNESKYSKENVQNIPLMRLSIREMDLFQKDAFKDLRNRTSFKLTPKMKISLNLISKENNISSVRRSKRQKKV